MRLLRSYLSILCVLSLLVSCATNETSEVKSKAVEVTPPAKELKTNALPQKTQKVTTDPHIDQGEGRSFEEIKREPKTLAPKTVSKTSISKKPIRSLSKSKKIKLSNPSRKNKLKVKEPKRLKAVGEN